MLQTYNSKSETKFNMYTFIRLNPIKLPIFDLFAPKIAFSNGSNQVLIQYGTHTILLTSSKPPAATYA